MALKPWMGAGLVALILLGASALHPSHAAAAENTAAASVQFEGNLLRLVTPQWLATAKVKYADGFAYLQKLNDAEGFPPGTLQTMWVIESMAGELNIRNGSGYAGHFQLGRYEADKYCPGMDVFQLQGAAVCTVRLLRDYHMQFQGHAKQQVHWQERTRTDFYDLHRSGFRGAAEQYNVIVHGASFRDRKLVRNIRVNMPVKYKGMLFDTKGKLNPGVSDRDLAVFFYRMWDYEVNRIWNAIK